LLGGVVGLAGCMIPRRPPPPDDTVPFEGAIVVRPEDDAPVKGDPSSATRPQTDVPVDRFIIGQIKQVESQLPKTVRLGRPQMLWFPGEPGRREGVAVVFLARSDVYVQPPKRPLRGNTRRLLADLMGSVGGRVMHGHRVPQDATSQVEASGRSLAQGAYAVLESVGLTGRIQNANRWVIGSFRESDDPVDAFRPMFDRLWEACESLRESEPVLVIGPQVLNEDDLRLRRLYRRAGRQVDWPTYGGSAPDPGLALSPKLGQP